MLRGAAKNFARVAPLCRPDQYGFVLDELRSSGELSIETRRQLATEAFATTAAYEAAIAAFFADREGFPGLLTLSFEKVTDLAYGENPHQHAAYYAEAVARLRGARAGARGEVHRRPVRARLRRRRARGAEGQAEHAAAARPRAPPLRPGREGLQARRRRPARAGPRLGHRGARADGGALRQ